MEEAYLAFLQVIWSDLFYCLIYGYAVLFEIHKISSFVLNIFLMFQSPKVTWYETAPSLSKFF